MYETCVDCENSNITTTTTTTTVLYLLVDGYMGKNLNCCPTPLERVPTGDKYSNCQVPVLGCILYNSNGTPYQTLAYTYNNVCYETNSSGVIISVFDCSATTTTTTTTEPLTTTTTTTAGERYYVATQYLNCVQNGGVNESIIYSPSPITQPWVCGDDGYQYELGPETSPTSPYVTAQSSANSCGTLSC